MDISKQENIALEVYSLLEQKDFVALGKKYSYSMSFGEHPAIAIRNDFQRSLNQCKSKLDSGVLDIRVKNFKDNKSGLSTLIECEVNFGEKLGSLLVEMVGNKDNEYHIEQISHVT